MPTNYIGMYDQKLTTSNNLRALMEVEDINNITSVANGLLGQTSDGTTSGTDLTDEVLRARRIEYFYDKVLLDTIKLGTENNVFLKYCQTKEVPEGHSKLLLRRWGGLTEHISPLREGIPPQSDMMRSESFEGTFAQFGRYMEFTDRVEFNMIDPVIAHYSSVYGDLAVRTAERLAREELIAMSSKNYAGSASSIGDLMIGDVVTIADYRLMALKLERILVKPLNGAYTIICSPEHLYDLVEDPLVIAYMTYTNTAEPLKTGRPVEILGLRFEKTMLDDFGFTYVGQMNTAMYHPGEFTELDGESTVYKLRAYTIIDGVQYYINVPGSVGETNYRKVYNTVADEVAGFSVTPRKYLADGSYIPNLVSWEIDFATYLTNTTVIESKNPASGVVVENVAAASDGGVIGGDLLAALKAATWFELPVHKSFLIGQEYMVKTGISGRSGAKFYVKAKGSAGVLDPIDQRQSIGFKIDALGFTALRTEAMQTYFFVPTVAHETQQFAITNANTWGLTFNN
jgi:hypothetical protein